MARARKQVDAHAVQLSRHPKSLESTPSNPRSRKRRLSNATTQSKPATPSTADIEPNPTSKRQKRIEVTSTPSPSRHSLTPPGVLATSSNTTKDRYPTYIKLNSVSPLPSSEQSSSSFSVSSALGLGDQNLVISSLPEVPVQVALSSPNVSLLAEGPGVSGAENNNNFDSFELADIPNEGFYDDSDTYSEVDTPTIGLILFPPSPASRHTEAHPEPMATPCSTPHDPSMSSQSGLTHDELSMFLALAHRLAGGTPCQRCSERVGDGEPSRAPTVEDVLDINAGNAEEDRDSWLGRFLGRFLL